MSAPKSICVYSEVSEFLGERAKEFDQIPETRKAELLQLREYVRENLGDSGTANLTFVCTHNSRRSHLSQIWAQVVADACGKVGVNTFSGGTEATAMNPRVVASLKRSGFKIEYDDPNSTNPVYAVRYSDDAAPLTCFSKVYDQPPNPTSGYCAIMTCSSADNACPIVPGCALRIPIRYDDPKVADDTPEESAVYDERSRQICRELLFAFSE